MHFEKITELREALLMADTLGDVTKISADISLALGHQPPSMPDLTRMEIKKLFDPAKVKDKDPQLKTAKLICCQMITNFEKGQIRSPEYGTPDVAVMKKRHEVFLVLLYQSVLDSMDNPNIDDGLLLEQLAECLSTDPETAWRYIEPIFSGGNGTPGKDDTVGWIQNHESGKNLVLSGEGYDQAESLYKEITQSPDGETDNGISPRCLAALHNRRVEEWLKKHDARYPFKKTKQVVSVPFIPVSDVKFLNHKTTKPLNQ